MAPFRMSCVLLLLSACGGSSTGLEGIYELESWTVNPASCSAPGQPSFEEGQYSHFFVRGDSFFGEFAINVVTCDDLATCRQNAADTDTLYIGNFSFEDGDDDSGWTRVRSTLLEENDCAGTVYAAVLTGEPGATVQIEEQARTVDSAPLDPQGECDHDAAEAAAMEQPCESVTVVQGTYTEGI